MFETKRGWILWVNLLWETWAEDSALEHQFWKHCFVFSAQCYFWSEIRNSFFFTFLLNVMSVFFCNRCWGITIEKSARTNLRRITCSAIFPWWIRLWIIFSEESGLRHVLGEICSGKIAFSKLLYGISFEKSWATTLVMKLVLKMLLRSICFEQSALQHLLWASCFKQLLYKIVCQQDVMRKLLREVSSR